MVSAVAEKPVAEKPAVAAPLTKEQQVQNWRPKVQPIIGEEVYYWSDGRDGRTVASFGRVITVGDRSIEIMVQERSAVKLRIDVRHREDPQLVENDHLAQMGCWDYHPRVKQIRELEARVEAIEAALK